MDNETPQPEVVAEEAKKRGRPRNPLTRRNRDDERRRVAKGMRDYRESVRISNARKLQRERGIGFLAEQVALLPGGFSDFLPFLRAASARNETFMPAIEAFDKLSGWDKNRLGVNRFEEICVNLGIPLGELFGSAVGIAFEQQRDMTRLVAAVAMPRIMKRNIEEADKPEGIEDRRMFMQSTGILPTPRGSTINVSANANSASMTTQGEPSGLPSFEDSTISFSEVIRNAIEVPKALPEPVDVTPTEE